MSTFVQWGIEFQAIKTGGGRFWEVIHPGTLLGLAMAKTKRAALQSFQQQEKEKVFSAILRHQEIKDKARRDKRKQKRLDQIDAILMARNGWKQKKDSWYHSGMINEIRDHAIKLQNGKTVYPLYAEIERIRRDNVKAIDAINPASGYILNLTRQWTKDRNKAVLAMGGRLMKSKSGKTIGAITPDKEI